MALSKADIARMMDLSCVRAESTEREMTEAIEMALRYRCAAVFALPSHTPFIVASLKGSRDVLAGGVVGFPDGGATTRGKIAEAQELMEMGCGELDMVINIGWLKVGRDDRVAEDIRSVVQAAGTIPVKLILECHHLTEAEIVRACRIGADAGVTFVKTGTGWAPTGATAANVSLMRRTVGDRCGVKAAGGVRDLDTLLALNRAGATRFGIGVKAAAAILEPCHG